MSTEAVFNVVNEPLTQDFEQIFREHSQMVYRTAYSVTGSPQDAEDILQTLFLGLQMMQSLLADRFKLKVSWEARDVDGYVLTVAKGGTRLQPASGDEAFKQVETTGISGTYAFNLSL